MEIPVYTDIYGKDVFVMPVSPTRCYEGMLFAILFNSHRGELFIFVSDRSFERDSMRSTSVPAMFGKG